MKLGKKINRLKGRILQYIVFSILLIFMLLGGWCVPPKWMEKVISELKAKYTVEKILEDDLS
ncbi:MAG: hypothetical protein KJO12_07985 [Ignavibacteria bacterium]|nr:hypothetical protein [Ignavibacteria bacterium]